MKNCCCTRVVRTTCLRRPEIKCSSRCSTRWTHLGYWPRLTSTHTCMTSPSSLTSLTNRRTVGASWALPFLSVCPTVCLSVQCWYCIKTVVRIVKMYWPRTRTVVLLFESNWRYKIPRIAASSGGVKCEGRLAFFDLKSLLSRKRYEIGP